jgi:uncharacterized protein (DUF305 family)
MVTGLLAAIAVGGASPAGAQRSAPVATVQPAAQQAGDVYIARARADSIRHPYTEADIEFMHNMIGHHAQAIVMSRWAPTHGASAAVQTLAERIINAQQDEIRTMQQWLRDRRQQVPEPSPTGGPMPMLMGGESMEMLMPGMLTDAKLKELDQARGEAFDRLFLTDMIQHHRGAVSMVKDLFSSYGAAQDEIVFKFANDVNVDQTTEIARMERMLLSATFGIQAP